MSGIFNVAYAAETAQHSGISIHLAPKALGTVFGIPLTNTLVTVWVVMAMLIVTALFVRKNLTLVPGKGQLIFEELIGGVYTYVADTLEDEKLAKKVFPLIITIFVFILLINWVGLLPGVNAFGIYRMEGGEQELIPFFYPGDTDLNITLAFALIAFFTIEFLGVTAIGFWKYAGKFFNFSFLRKFNTENILAFFIGIIEFFSELARLVSFSFRLFGNMFAGKTLILVALFFVPFVVPVPLLAFELFVGFIQAFIFAVLTLFFIKLAVEEPVHH